MGQTKAGLAKMMETIRQKYGVDENGRSNLHVRIGAIGGSMGHTGGFAAKVNRAGFSGREYARIMGRKGGLISKRRPRK